MCIKKFDAEKIFFWQTDRVFNLYSRIQIAVSAPKKAGGDIFCYSCFDSIFG